MTYEIVSALITFAFVSSVTPGPNNLMLLASGVNFGVVRSLPHMIGISTGFVLMSLILGLGLVQLFDRYPSIHLALKILSVAYMLWLAWKIANASAPKTENSGAKPLSIWQAAAFQWVNPKAWAMATTALTVYAPTGDFRTVAMVSVIFGCVNFPTISFWVILGQNFRKVLSNPRNLRVFNITMALLLVASLWPILRA
ncbi:MAG: LysE family translocator [Rhodobacteraceae bacterium]|nr:LysE family translocator [Paracoccaceae bacterium]